MQDQELREVIQQTAHETAYLIREEIRQQVDEGVSDALTRVGIDMQDPLAAQRDAQFVRELRRTAGAMKRRGLLTAVGILVTALLGVLWLGLRGLLP